MKYTLLEMTQEILSSMTSDEVNSIDDTVESQQVAKIVRSTYFDIVNRLGLPEKYGHFNLTSSGDDTKPTLMTVPSTVLSIDWLKYNISDTSEMNYRDMIYEDFKTFSDRMYSLQEDGDNVGTFEHTANGQTINVLYTDDEAPRYFTTIDDTILLFDSYNSDVDTTLQSSKSLGYGTRSIPFTMGDAFTPTLDDPQFQLLLHEAKALAWAELRQTTHQKAEQAARRQWIIGSQTKNVVGDPFQSTLPNYGRK